uniref:dUTPase-like domain-containing protein n=1 Tax=Geospiza parvula TaxID=87175 RepID=A0A8C3Q8K0_GEOPR
MQSQVLAALASSQASINRPQGQGPSRLRCHRSLFGKQKSERASGSPRSNTSGGPEPECLPSTNASSLCPATSGSLGLDLATSIDCTLIDCKPQRIPTGIKGPITSGGQPVGALLIGRSSTSMLGLKILVGLIDADYTGEIQIMAQTLFPPLFILAGSWIAQLIPLPQLTGGVLPLNKRQRGEGGFGSTGTMAFKNSNWLNSSISRA